MTLMHVDTGSIFTLGEAICAAIDFAKENGEKKTVKEARAEVEACMCRVRRTRTVAEKEEYGKWIAIQI